MIQEGLGFGRRNLIKNIIIENWAVNKPEFKKFSYNELLFVIQELFTEEGKAYTSIKSPMLGHNIFRNFVKHLIYRNIANYDSMLLLTSEKGTGKSSAAIMVAREICRNLGIRFNPNRHIAYNNKDISNKIDILNKFEPIIADESVRFCSSEDWNKRESKELKKKLAQVRTKHLFFILCFPLKIQKVDKVYLESNVNYWIDLFGRGRGAIYVRDKNPTQDSWRMKEFSKIGSYTEFTMLNKVEQALKKHPNFWTTIKFPKPPRWLYNRYLKVREKNVYDDNNLMGSVTKEDIHNALLVLALRDIMMHDDIVNLNRIILHIKNEYDIPMTKQLVQTTIDDAKQLIAKVRETALVEA